MKSVSLMLMVLLGLTGRAWLPAAFAAEETIHIVDAQSRPTPLGTTAGVVYLTLMNHGAVDDTLLSLSTPVATRAELHRTSSEDGLPEAAPVNNFIIKANDGVTFKPGGLHIMLIGVKLPLKLGQSFPLTLTFAKAGNVDVDVAVSPQAGKSAIAQPMPGMKM